MLQSKFINDPSIKQAAEEVMGNIRLLILAGYHHDAMFLSEKLVNPGPWQINPHTAQIHDLQRLHPILCWLCDKDCPEISDEPALDRKQLKSKAEANWDAILDNLLMSNGLQIEPAGANWNDTFFHNPDLFDENDDNRISKPHAQFVNDVDWVLKDRLRTITNRSAPSLLPDCFADFLPEYNTDSDILTSPNAHRYESRYLTDKVAEFSESWRNKSGHSDISYMEITIFLMQLTMDILAENETSELKQIDRLLSDKDKFELMEFTYWTRFRDRLRSGAYRQTIGISDADIADYCKAMERRNRSNKSSKIITKVLSSAVDLKTLREIAQDTPLNEQEFVELPVPLSDQYALATKVKHNTALSLWGEAQAVVKSTGRWPVLIMDWYREGSTWQQTLTNANLFDRRHFQNEHYDGDRVGLSTQDLIASSKCIQLEDAHHKLATTRYNDIGEFLSYQLEGDDELMARITSNIDSSSLGAYSTASRLLGSALIEKNGLTEPFPITWYKPGPTDYVFLLLMPTENSWEIPAYLQWYGSESCGSEVTIAQLKEWNDNFGAELVCHYGTMLQLSVNRKPDSIDEALDLAYAQDSLASGTIGGSTIPDYANALMHSDIWFLHERP